MQRQAKPVPLLPASVVLATVVDRICFKALQLFGGVQRGLLPFACQSLKQLQQSFHASIVRHHSRGSPGYGDRALTFFGGLWVWASNHNDGCRRVGVAAMDRDCIRLLFIDTTGFIIA